MPDARPSKEEAKQLIQKLIDKYEKAKAEGKIRSFSEEDTKKNFIVPMFEALGWDMRSEEVKAEHRASKGWVDYAFMLNEIPKFFLEAKALKVDLDIPKWSEQAINYAWHKNVYWAVLTDFEGIRVFNAEVKSKSLVDKQLFHLPYTKYMEYFDRIWLLSKESFEKGLIDAEAESWGKKRRKVPIGKQLLTDFTSFREKLSKNILKNNKGISGDDLDESVQRLLDRLIFIRTCEDRELEAPTLNPLVREEKHKKITTKLNAVFRRYDEKYNSKLFMPHHCEDVSIDNRILEEIIEGLYGTKDGLIRYQFDLIDADVLGNIYEQYLGHILKKKGRGAKLESGKAHRKEQGIFYTPTYVVDYIVKNTLGNYLDGKKDETVKNLKILDPACGSGSFLIKSFDYLNKYWIDRTKSDTLARRQNILENNLYGVDLDPKAIEIAQLNLLLKALHGTARNRKLPLLKSTIKNGNSLIDDEQIAGDKSFKWNDEFEDIMNAGGFDVIIGNPPYIRVQTAKSEEKNYLSQHYVSAEGKYDLYVVFIEKALRLLKDGGYFSFIVPNKFTQTKYGKKLKDYLLENFVIERIVDFGDLKVFGNVTTYPCILVIKKEKPTNQVKGTYVKVKNLSEGLINEINLHQDENYFESDDLKLFKFDQNKLDNTLWSFMAPDVRAIFDKINNSSKIKLADLSDRIYEGFITGNNSVFFINTKTAAEYNIEKSLLKPVPKGKNVRRYSIQWSDEFVLFPHKQDDERSVPVNIAKYPNAKKYLDIHETALKMRKYVIKAGKYWYEIWNPRKPSWFEQDKIITPNLSSSNNFCVDFNTNSSGEYYFIDHDCYGIILKNKQRSEYLAMLGILNSKPIEFFIKKKSPMFSGGYYKYHTQYLENIPIPHLPAQVKKDLVGLVKRILSLKTRLNAMEDKRTDERLKIEEDIQRTDKKIDALVYKLYNLTPKEIEIIEGS